ncbi:MAG: hypothetical protein IAF38_03515 [Bacteroidia bacterium]|nr:hypothetical protein [Bacteroidia bacterium]
MYIFLSFSGILIFIEDVRTRLVTVWKILLIIAVSLGICAYSITDLDLFLKTILLNISVILIIYFSLVIFYFFKEKKFNFALKNKAGLADALLFVAPAICFSNVLFLYFILLSVLGALIYSIFLFIVRRKSENKITIPLAGICSLLFCISIIALEIFKIDRFDNAALFEKFMLP